MPEPTEMFYDELAESYHLIFQDWAQAVERQAGILGPLIESEVHGGELRILDCACGIGTQTLGLAQRGHTLVGVDLSKAAISRAKREAKQRNLAIEFKVSDMRDLPFDLAADFDAVIAVDNALPHMLTEQDLRRSIQQMVKTLRPGGLFLASIRDYEKAVHEHPIQIPPAFFRDGVRRRIYHQIWDWITDRQYQVHLYITRERSASWTCQHFVSTYRAVLQTELTVMLAEAGLSELRWLSHAESGFYQPIVLGHRQRSD